MRATDSPTSISSPTRSSEAGPIVATILVAERVSSPGGVAKSSAGLSWVIGRTGVEAPEGAQRAHWDSGAHRRMRGRGVVRARAGRAAPRTEHRPDPEGSGRRAVEGPAVLRPRGAPFGSTLDTSGTPASVRRSRHKVGSAKTGLSATRARRRGGVRPGLASGGGIDFRARRRQNGPTQLRATVVFLGLAP